MTDHLGSPSLLRRLTAIFYDAWLVLACLLAVSALVIGLRITTDGAQSIGDGERALSGKWDLILFTCSVFTIYTFYSYFWLKNGQTLGMQTWRIKLVSANQEPINHHQAFIRFISAALSFAIFGLGYLWQLIDKDGKSLHDRLSNTQLILLPKRKN